jgi:hypothetical protein
MIQATIYRFNLANDFGQEGNRNYDRLYTLATQALTFMAVSLFAAI